MTQFSYRTVTLRLIFLTVLLLIEQNVCLGLAHCRRSFLSKIVTTTVGGSCIVATSPQLSNAATQTDVTMKNTMSPTTPPTNMKAPNFVLPNSRDSGETSLNKLIQNGKWTVLYFYPGAFTQGCTLEARNFQRDIDEYRTLNTQIVGVSVDPPEKNAQFCSKEGLDFYMLSDTGGKVSQLYGSALSIPGFGTFSNRQTYIIDPNGYLRYVFTNVESRIPRHSTEVIEKLKELEQDKFAMA
jgi:thioredoxin-dependent peroxiredoxin